MFLIVLSQYFVFLCFFIQNLDFRSQLHHFVSPGRPRAIPQYTNTAMSVNTTSLTELSRHFLLSRKWIASTHLNDIPEAIKRLKRLTTSRPRGRKGGIHRRRSIRSIHGVFTNSQERDYSSAGVNRCNLADC